MTAERDPVFIPLAVAGTIGAAGVLGGVAAPAAEMGVGLAWAATAGVAAATRGIGADRLERLILAAVGWGVVAAALANTAPLAAKETLAGWLVAWVVLGVGRRMSDTAREGSHLVLGAAAVLVAAGILAEYAGFGRLRVGGPFENPNVAAAVLAPMLPAWLAGRGRGRSWWRVAGALVLAAAVVATGSRAALLALVAGAAVAPRRAKWRWVAGFAGAAAAAAAIWWRFHLSPDPLAWYRIRIWRAVVRVFAASPVFGVGPGGLADAAGVVRPASPAGCGIFGHRILYAESSLLGWMVATGLIGCVLGLIMLAVLWREARRGGRLRNPAARAVIATIVVLAAVHDFLQAGTVLWWWAAVLAPLVPVQPRPGPDGRAAGGRRRWPAAVLGAGLILLGTVQPGAARWLGAGGAGAAVVERQMRLEPWLGAAPLARVRSLLGRPGRWRRATAGEALLRAEQAVAAHPGSARGWASLAQVNRRVVADLGRWPTAVAAARSAYARACSLEPHTPWYRLDWARLERSAGDLDRARQLVLHVTRDEPNCVPAWLLLGRVELDRGRLAAAREALARAREARLCGRGRLLSAYERALLSAPEWQWRELEGALP